MLPADDNAMPDIWTEMPSFLVWAFYNSPDMFVALVLMSMLAVAILFLIGLMLTNGYRNPYDPYSGFDGVDFEYRTWVAGRVLAACLPDHLANPVARTKAVYMLDAAKHPSFTLHTAQGDEIFVPGETAAIVLRLLSPALPKEHYGVLDRECAAKEEKFISNKGFGPRALGDIDRRYGPVASADSQLARHRAARKTLRARLRLKFASPKERQT